MKHSVEKLQDSSFWYRDPNWQQVTYELVQIWLKNWHAGRLIWFLFSTGLICTGQLVGPSLALHSRNRMKTGWRDAGEVVLKVTHTAVTSCWTPLSHDCSMEVCKPCIYGLVEHAKRLKKQRERSLCQLLKRKERQGENTYLKVCVEETVKIMSDRIILKLVSTFRWNEVLRMNGLHLLSTDWLEHKSFESMFILDLNLILSEP